VSISFLITDLKINGNEVMKALKIHSGPLVGKLLNKLFEEVIDKKLKNEKTVLLKRLKQIVKEIV